MRKRSPIEPGSSVSWMVKVHPQLEYIAPVDAKVLTIDGDMATIEVSVAYQIDAKKEHFVVPLKDLQNKSWEIDQEAVDRLAKERFAKAEIVEGSAYGTYWDGWVTTDDGDRLFNSADEYLEYCEDEEVEPDDFLWCVDAVKLKPYSADHFVEDIEEQYGSECPPDIYGVDELQQAIDAFYKANEHIKSAKTNYGKVVLVKGKKSEVSDAVL